MSAAAEIERERENGIRNITTLTFANFHLAHSLEGAASPSTLADSTSSSSQVQPPSPLFLLLPSSFPPSPPPPLRHRSVVRTGFCCLPFREVSNIRWTDGRGGGRIAQSKEGEGGECFFLSPHVCPAAQNRKLLRDELRGEGKEEEFLPWTWGGGGGLKASARVVKRGARIFFRSKKGSCFECEKDMDIGHVCRKVPVDIRQK